MKKIITFGLFVLLTSCKETSNKEKPLINEEVAPVVNTKGVDSKVNAFTSLIESAHYKTDFLKEEVVSCDLEISFGGNIILDGTLTQLTNGTKIRIDNKLDSSKIIFNNKEAFISPSEVEDPRARFHIFTWSYFFSLPFKLNDPGTKRSNSLKKKWGNSMLDTQRLTFEEGIGDAPKDWYILYKNSSNLLDGAAYIVSYGKDIREAEKEPHAIKYNNFKKIKGIPIATNWTFHMWNDTIGYGKQIGEVKLKNIKFLKNTSELFKKSENSRTLNAVN